MNVVDVKTIAAEKHMLQAVLDVTGVLVPAQTVNISAKTGGQIKSIHAEVGDSVNAGDITVMLETKEQDAQLQQAEAVLKSAYDQAAQAKLNMEAAEEAYDSAKLLLADQEVQAKLNLAIVEKNYNRTKELADIGAVPQSQLDEAESKYQLAKKQYEMARAETGSSAQNQLLSAKSKHDLAVKQYAIASGSTLAQAQAGVNTIRVQLENAVIKSPISGVVVNKNINSGEIASPNAVLLAIADTSTLKLKGTVSQEALPHLKSGQEIKVLVDIYPDKAYIGKIENIGPMAVSTGAVFPIEISVENPGDIKAGLSAHASIEMAEEKGVVVPAAAVVQKDGESYVFVIKDNIALKRIVTIGLKNNKETEILKGIAAGDRVAVTNVNSLFDNMRVNAE